MRGKRKAIGLGLAVSLLAPCWVASQQVIIRDWISGPPTIPDRVCGTITTPNTVVFRFGCYSAKNGEPHNCESEWVQEFKLDGAYSEELKILWQGGHAHPRPQEDSDEAFHRAVGGVVCPIDPNQEKLTRFHGFTANKTWQKTKLLPEASGVIRLDGWMRLSMLNLRWIDDLAICFREDPQDRVYTRCKMGVSVGVFGLKLLPDNPSLYRKVSNPMGHFPGKQFYGTPAMIAAITKMAEDYKQQFGVLLSFNDLSLPWGGVFDLGKNWTCPHKFHRLGTSVDVNHAVYRENEPNPVGQVKKKELDEIAASYGLVQFHENELLHYELVGKKGGQ
jgi:hypothetical protein